MERNKKFGLVLVLAGILLAVRGQVGAVGPVRVLIVEDRAARAALPPEQQLQFTSKRLLDFLDAKCLKDGEHPGYRMFDVKQDVSKEPAVFQEMFEEAKKVPPPSLTVRGKKKYTGPLPPKTDDTIKQLQKYTGA